MKRVIAIVAASFLALLLCSLAAAFFPVPEDASAYRDATARMDALMASGAVVTSEELDKMFPEPLPEPGPHDFASDMWKSLDWRPWVSAVAALITFCIFRPRVRPVAIASSIVALVLVAIGSLVAAAYFVAGAIAYLAGYHLFPKLGGWRKPGVRGPR